MGERALPKAIQSWKAPSQPPFPTIGLGSFEIQIFLCLPPIKALCWGPINHVPRLDPGRGSGAGVPSPQPEVPKSPPQMAIVPARPGHRVQSSR